MNQSSWIMKKDLSDVPEGNKPGQAHFSAFHGYWASPAAFHGGFCDGYLL
jgi:hypothetical protein